MLATQTNGNRVVGGKHANPRLRFSRSPRRSDDIAEFSAEALAVLRPSLKTLAAMSDRSVSQMSKWCSEGKGSPVFEFFTLLDALSHHDADAAGALVAYAETLHARALMSADTAELVARFWRLSKAECEAQGEEDSAFADFAATGDLKAYARALRLESSVQARLAGVCEELAERGIDPRNYGGR